MSKKIVNNLSNNVIGSVFGVVLKVFVAVALVLSMSLNNGAVELNRAKAAVGDYSSGGSDTPVMSISDTMLGDVTISFVRTTYAGSQYDKYCILLDNNQPSVNCGESNDINLYTTIAGNNPDENVSEYMFSYNISNSKISIGSHVIFVYSKFATVDNWNSPSSSYPAVSFTKNSYKYVGTNDFPLYDVANATGDNIRYFLNTGQSESTNVNLLPSANVSLIDGLTFVGWNNDNYSTATAINGWQTVVNGQSLKPVYQVADPVISPKGEDIDVPDDVDVVTYSTLSSFVITCYTTDGSEVSISSFDASSCNGTGFQILGSTVTIQGLGATALATLKVRTFPQTSVTNVILSSAEVASTYDYSVNVKYNTNGGNGSINDSLRYVNQTVSDAVLDVSSVTKSGYTLAGFYNVQNSVVADTEYCSGTQYVQAFGVITEATIPSKGTLNLYACWVIASAGPVVGVEGQLVPGNSQTFAPEFVLPDSSINTVGIKFKPVSFYDSTGTPDYNRARYCIVKGDTSAVDACSTGQHYDKIAMTNMASTPDSNGYITLDYISVPTAASSNIHIYAKDESAESWIVSTSFTSYQSAVLKLNSYIYTIKNDDNSNGPFMFADSSTEDKVSYFIGSPSIPVMILGVDDVTPIAGADFVGWTDTYANAASKYANNQLVPGNVTHIVTDNSVLRPVFKTKTPTIDTLGSSVSTPPASVEVKVTESVSFKICYTVAVADTPDSICTSGTVLSNPSFAISGLGATYGGNVLKAIAFHSTIGTDYILPSAQVTSTYNYDVDVTFDLNSGTGTVPAPQTLVAGDAVVAVNTSDLVAPTGGAYTFFGFWSSQTPKGAQSCLGTDYILPDGTSSSITIPVRGALKLYACWTSEPLSSVFFTGAAEVLVPDSLVPTVEIELPLALSLTGASIPSIEYCLSTDVAGVDCTSGAILEWESGHTKSFVIQYAGATVNTPTTLYAFAKSGGSQVSLPVNFTIFELDFSDDNAPGGSAIPSLYAVEDEVVKLQPADWNPDGALFWKWCSDDNTCASTNAFDPSAEYQVTSSKLFKGNYKLDAPLFTPEPDAVTSASVTLALRPGPDVAGGNIKTFYSIVDGTGLDACVASSDVVATSGNPNYSTTAIDITEGVTVYAITCTNGAGIVKYFHTSDVDSRLYSLDRTVTFDNNGGVGNVPDTQTVNIGDYVADLGTSGGDYVAPTYSGYTLAGWYDAKTDVTPSTSACLGDKYVDADGTVDTGTSPTITSNLELYACWIKTFTVTFNNNGGTGDVPDTQEVVYGSSVAVLTTADSTYVVPAFDGYTLFGWYAPKNNVSPSITQCSTDQYADGEGNPIAVQTVTSDLTLWACWIDTTAPDAITGVTVTIPNQWVQSVRLTIPTTIDTGNVTANNKLEYCVSLSATVYTANPSCDDSLLDWSRKSSAFNIDYTEFTLGTPFSIYVYVKDLAENVSVATQVDVTIYSIEYDLNNGSNSAVKTPQYIISGQDAVVQGATPVIAGTSFLTWCDSGYDCPSVDVSTSGVEYSPSDTIYALSANLVLTAIYKFNTPLSSSFTATPATFDDLDNGEIAGVTSDYEYAQLTSGECSALVDGDYATASGDKIADITGSGASYCIRHVAIVAQGVVASDAVQIDVPAGIARVYEPSASIDVPVDLEYGYDDTAYYAYTLDNSASNSPIVITVAGSSSSFEIIDLSDSGTACTTGIVLEAGEKDDISCILHFLVGQDASTYTFATDVQWHSVAGYDGQLGVQHDGTIDVGTFEQKVLPRELEITAYGVVVYQNSILDDYLDILTWDITTGELVGDDTVAGGLTFATGCVDISRVGVYTGCVVEDSANPFTASPVATNYNITVIPGDVTVAEAFRLSDDEEKLISEPGALCRTVNPYWSYSAGALTVNLDAIGQYRIDINTFVAGKDSVGSCINQLLTVNFSQTGNRVRNVIVDDNVFAQGESGGDRYNETFAPETNSLQNVNFSSKLKSIELGTNAFLQVATGSNTLASINFGNVQSLKIGKNALRQVSETGSTALTSIAFPEGLRDLTVGSGGFAQHSLQSNTLANVTFPSTLTSLYIGDFGFYQFSDNGNTALVNANFSAGIQNFTLGVRAFEQRAGQDATLVSVTFPSRLQTLNVGERAFYQHAGYYLEGIVSGNVALKSVKFPDSLYTLNISERAFEQSAHSNAELVNITFPADLVNLNIGDYAFEQNSHDGGSALVNVVFPLHLKNLTIGADSFRQRSDFGNAALTNVIFPVHLNTLNIGDEAFLQEVNDPNAKTPLSYFFFPTERAPGEHYGYITLGTDITTVINNSSVAGYERSVPWTWYGDSGVTNGYWSGFVVSGGGNYTLNHTDGPVEMYRLYNPNSGEHFYTATVAERDNIIATGWSYEGIGWIAPNRGQSVYRMYNANVGDHHYTMMWKEVLDLQAAGWIFEGVGWYSGGSTSIWRAYNPWARTSTHNYTSTITEQMNLLSFGWTNEGVGWYGLGETCEKSSVYTCEK